MDSIVDYIFREVAAQRLSNKEAKTILTELQGLKNSQKDDIAIIGMACKFAGANNIYEYWDNLVNGVNSVKPFPEQRKIGLYEANLDNLHFYGGHLDEIDKFDAAFFRISPQEAQWMTPNQRLMLETAWAAIEDSGYDSSKLYGTRTGVYIGHDNCLGNDYRENFIDVNEANPMVTTGSDPCILSRRISYALNLKGPSIVLDTACSSGLVAVHSASQAIKNEECDMAIAGSVFVRPSGQNDGSFSVIEGSGSMQRSFDDRSNGTIWGEGVAALILKPLKKALADKDNIYAVIKGGRMNNDGLSSGLTAPHAESQEELAVRVWNELKINPENLSYIEAHGTGTKIGDPIEITALTNAFRRFTSKKQFCALGTVKPNIGHPLCVSGLAVVIKVALALKNKKIPPTINFGIPNRHINFYDSPVFLNDKLKDWEKADKPRLAAVNSFGLSGTNCHMILEEAPQVQDNYNCNDEKPCVLVLSAKDPEVLENLVKEYTKYLGRHSATGLEDICYTANTGRGHYSYRLAVVSKNKSDLKDKLMEISSGGLKSEAGMGVYYGVHKIVNRANSLSDKGEITETEKQQLSTSASEKVKNLAEVKENQEEALEVMAQYYVKGADINWEELLFEGKSRIKTSLPAYQFKRTRYWSKIKSVVSAQVLKQEGEINSSCKQDSKIRPEEKSVEVLSREFSGAIAGDLNFGSNVPSNDHRIALSLNENEKADIRVTLKGRGDNGVYSDIETKLADIWAGLFGLEEVDINDDFYTLGGNSLITIKMEVELEKVFGIEVDGQNILAQNDTIEKLALYIAGKAGA
ncbi:MAG: phosphopantetheine-binding protein [Clostridia bacterium]|nr:phosphopantetheine-binding protein [Clostridia bacterium]